MFNISLVLLQIKPQTVILRSICVQTNETCKERVSKKENTVTIYSPPCQREV